jgi:hypothetical protein
MPTAVRRNPKGSGDYTAVGISEARRRCQFRQKDVLEDERAAVPHTQIALSSPEGQFHFRKDLAFDDQ